MGFGSFGVVGVVLGEGLLAVVELLEGFGLGSSGIICQFAVKAMLPVVPDVML